ncbi:hypothetical protein [Micromonospora mirobrigensis]|uniref:Uncharacterized protein n=1 Tax=Micromonospora mirobrigensis TaxID=262898 RepID=A0A1C4V609_9ACTN|nr:hypothetical protein [Micromonospora mirobrigensis]SCE79135.1 hypothetical protein GA0070564_101966 [Micromonospora mirobrigensis]
MTGRTTVDVLSLEDFKQRLAGRLAEAEATLRKLGVGAGRPPALGRFADAGDNADRYGDVLVHYVTQVDRLRLAVAAADAATDTIITNYRTAEERNAANAAEIIQALSGVDAALGGAGEDQGV